MAYNSVNKLELIIRIQNYYLEKREEGVMVKWIFEDVSKQYCISRRTFYNYLDINAKQKLKDLNHGTKKSSGNSKTS